MTTEAYNKPDKVLLKRYSKTLEFIKNRNLNKKLSILDLGTENPFTELLSEEGYEIYNTGKTDLDLDPEIVKEYNTSVTLALEILEHLVSPFPLLKYLPGLILL